MLIFLGTSVISIGSADHYDRLYCGSISVTPIQVEEAKTVPRPETVDTDVLVILVGKLHDLREVQPELDLWLAFGMGRKLPLHQRQTLFVLFLGKPRSTSLPVFHALNWLRYHLLLLRGKERSQPWQAWEIFPEVTPHIRNACPRTPCMQLTTGLAPLQNRSRDYTVILYDKLSPLIYTGKCLLLFFIAIFFYVSP